MVYPYKIKTKEDLVKLCELACQEDFPIYIILIYSRQVNTKKLIYKNSVYLIINTVLYCFVIKYSLSLSVLSGYISSNS